MFNKIFKKTLTSRHSKVPKENKNNYQIGGLFFPDWSPLLSYMADGTAHYAEKVGDTQQLSRLQYGWYQLEYLEEPWIPKENLLSLRLLGKPQKGWNTTTTTTTTTNNNNNNNNNNQLQGIRIGKKSR